MDDRELEKILKAAKEECNSFFSGWKFEPYRKIVHLRTSKEGACTQKESRKTFRWTVLGKTAGVVAFVCLLVLFSFALGARLFDTQDPVSDYATSVNRQVVNFSSNEPAYLLEFYRLQKPNYSSEDLMAVVWKLTGHGNYKMMYSSLLESSDEPYPASEIDFPGGDNRLIIISSGNSSNQYMHYRLLGYSNGSIKALWSQDFVRDGHLGIKKGTLIEQRKTEGAFSRITYIIPYYIDESGEPLLPLSSVQMKVGEQLVLVSNDDEKHAEVVSEKNLVKKAEESGTSENRSAAVFYASDPGEDYLVLIPNNDREKGKSLLVTVE